MRILILDFVQEAEASGVTDERRGFHAFLRIRGSGSGVGPGSLRQGFLRSDDDSAKQDVTYMFAKAV